MCYSVSNAVDLFSLCSLVAGDVEGNIKQLFSKVQGILKKNGPFEVHWGPAALILKCTLFRTDTCE